MALYTLSFYLMSLPSLRYNYLKLVAKLVKLVLLTHLLLIKFFDMHFQFPFLYVMLQYTWTEEYIYLLKIRKYSLFHINLRFLLVTVDDSNKLLQSKWLNEFL